jgi:hypothetical protein
MKVTVTMYTGSAANGAKLMEVCDLMHKLDVYSPTMPIEAFLVPIPADPHAADVLRQSMIHKIEDIFDQYDEDGVDFH